MSLTCWSCGWSHKKPAIRSVKPKRDQRAKNLLAVPNVNAGQTVLVVDYEPLLRFMIQKVLALEHHQVSFAASGQEALQALQLNKFNLIIADFDLPDMKGDVLSGIIKAADPEQRILVLTTNVTDVNVISDSMRVNFDGWLSKPFKIHDLLQTVRTLKTRPISP